VVNDLISEYKLDHDQSSLVGCGGGAGALIPFTANRMNIRYQIPDNADVISSIGVALAMVRDVVERVIPTPSEDDIAKIRREAIESAIRLGAEPSGVEVVIEIDSVKQRVRATAIGATELKTESLMKDCTEEEARKIAADSMGLSEENLTLNGKTTGMYVFTADVHEKKRFGTSLRSPVRIIDKKGFIKLQHSDSFYAEFTVSEADEKIVPLWEKHTTYRGDVPMSPDLFLVVGSHVIEISNIVYKEQISSIANAQLVGLPDNEEILVVGVPHA
jgi:hypothetical protein